LIAALARYGMHRHPYGDLHLAAAGAPDGSAHLRVEGYISAQSALLLSKLLEAELSEAEPR
jgi:hypothetical protein